MAVGFEPSPKLVACGVLSLSAAIVGILVYCARLPAQVPPHARGPTSQRQETAPPSPPPSPRPAPPPPYPQAPRFIKKPKDLNTAVCIVGELRTFPMPVAHLSILEMVRAWRADVFIAYHTRYNPDHMCLPSKQSVNCDVNQTAFDLLAPKQTRYLDFPECTSRPGSGYSQFHGTDLCFRDAERYARRRNFTYDLFVRLRPDFAFLQTPAVPRVSPRSNVTFAHGRHADFAFMVRC